MTRLEQSDRHTKRALIRSLGYGIRVHCNQPGIAQFNKRIEIYRVTDPLKHGMLFAKYDDAINWIGGHKPAPRFRGRMWAQGHLNKIERRRTATDGFEYRVTKDHGEQSGWLDGLKAVKLWLRIVPY